MRWFLGLVLVIALLVGVSYGVGRFLLSNALEVTRAITIERPRASVFAMANDLRIAREWSPYYAMDPDAEYAFSGPVGAGQSMRWSSNVREVGSGRIAIVNSIENQQIESILTLRDKATLNSRFDLRAVQGGAHVSWTVTAQCAEGWINVPCRYMNLILSGLIESHLDQGLARLKTLAEQLPNIDFEGYGIAQDNADAQNVIFVDVSIAAAAPTFADRAAAEAEGLSALNAYMAATGGEITRDNTLVRVFPLDNGEGGRFRFSVGYPYSGPAPLRLVGVRVGQTPEGSVLRVPFEGRRSQIASMYERLSAYVQAHRIVVRPGVEAWEVVDLSSVAQSDYAGDPIERAVIYFPIE